jgi:mono/diheme cytochrome c family protein
VKRFLNLMTVSALITLSACGADAGEAQDADSSSAAAGAASEAAAGCAACHSGPLAFTGRDPAEIAKLITNINDGGKAHPPLNFPATDPASIRSLADALTQN